MISDHMDRVFHLRQLLPRAVVRSVLEISLNRVLQFSAPVSGFKYRQALVAVRQLS